MIYGISTSNSRVSHNYCSGGTEEVGAGTEEVGTGTGEVGSGNEVPSVVNWHDGVVEPSMETPTCKQQPPTAVMLRSVWVIVGSGSQVEGTTSPMNTLAGPLQ
jgi:hypothetical protein